MPTTTIVKNQQQSESQTVTPSDCISYSPIGYIETSFDNKRAVPRQATVLSKAKGVVVIDPCVFNNPEHALCGLEDFSHMWIIFHFHSTGSSSVPAKVSPPRLGGDRKGVFSTRSPHRPCPIGLSLVKIHNIEGNRICFQGVDMINGTPVLDIKPYIPQYDYPSPSYEPMLSLDRPPTEGLSEAVRDLQINNIHSVLPDSPFDEDIPSIQDNSTPSSHSSPDAIDGIEQSPVRLDFERGAPDGQERFTPPQTQLNLEGIRVPNWITNPPSQTYDVRFTDEAMERLYSLIGDRAEAFKSNIESLLCEDPRSLYVRTRYSDHEYCCVLEDLSISCVFDANSAICTIVAVRNADDLQN
ncbi:unnamed protein product [Leptidea sinapis]|uniref:TsaA-like domain-containing protein n=1 Tax=Leptidea sinapis TaxID=189913 RepID=A0A5E4PM76_9NEOP|nr:unnamed protein product [Leptidea sinapis]